MDLLRITVGNPPAWMINSARKRSQFYDRSGKLLRSQKASMPDSIPDKARPIATALKGESEDFIDFVEVSSTSLGQ